MQNKTVEEYIKEMREMNIRAKPVVSEAEEVSKPLENLGKGGLIIVVNEAQNRPLKNATVTVTDSATGERVANELTDISGKTKIIELPAPLKSETLSPSGEKIVYGLYDVSVSAENFIDFALKEVPVFDSVVSIQTVNLLWKWASGGENQPMSDTEEQPYNL